MTYEEAHVLVIGDLILDEYVVGSAYRLSPEAPVPVVEVESRTDRAGGAANVAVNVAALGGRATLIGVVGDDLEAQRLGQALAERGRLVPVTIEGRPTTIKTRVVANGAQIVRFDREGRGPLPAAAEEALVVAIRRAALKVDAIVVSDYLKGTVTDRVLGSAFEMADQRGIPCVVDPKRPTFEAYAGARVLTPNLAEATRAARAVRGTPTRELLWRLRAQAPNVAWVITEGPDGMTVAAPGAEPVRIAARSRAVFDRTGAGDTVVGSLALGLAGGLTLVEAARLANAAASVVVGKPGVATVDADELAAAMEQG